MNELKVNPDLTKEEIFDQVEKFLIESGYQISSKDMNRPWGGFFVLDESQILKFRTDFFPEVSFSESQTRQKLSPKFLLVAPQERLSWQYHFRRAELWKLILGQSAISRSKFDEQGSIHAMKLGEVVSLEKGERHRLIGTSSWGVVAEIWMHSDPENPSDESDIVRLQDDYSRK